jgi:hypothetical protein
VALVTTRPCFVENGESNNNGKAERMVLTAVRRMARRVAKAAAERKKTKKCALTILSGHNIAAEL